jgi:hypothetical protein
MLNDELGVIEGSIALAGYAHHVVPDWRVDPDFRLFGAIASETDHLPFGEVRDRWSQDGLAKADAEIEAISDAYRPKVREACTSLIARFGSGKPAGIHRVTLFRPVGPKELELIAASGWSGFPPRLPGQPIFYPVTTEAYAVQIARDWNSLHDSKSTPISSADTRCSKSALLFTQSIGFRQKIWTSSIDIFSVRSK